LFILVFPSASLKENILRLYYILGVMLGDK
jgi:hypothetical protein